MGLLDHPTVSRCTARGIAAAASADTTGNAAEVLRLELYSDLLLALAFQGDAAVARPLESFYARLGRTAPEGVSEALLDSALAAIWAALQSTPLHYVHVTEGCFEHLGTTREVLALVGSSEQSGGKLQRFAEKYALQTSVGSRLWLHRDVVLSAELVDSVVADKVFVNCSVAVDSNVAAAAVFEEQEPYNENYSYHPQQSHAAAFQPETSPVVSSGSSLVEHCLLPHRALSAIAAGGCVLSHLGSAVTSKLRRLPSGTMLQQVHVKRHAAASSGACFALLCLNSGDDVKKSAQSAASSVCGSSWARFYQVF